MVVAPSKPWGPASAGSAADVQRALDALQAFGSTLSIKLYRVHLDPPPPVPVIPCLDHEAMLHQNVPPHAAAYLQEQPSGELHEVAFYPAARRIQIDTTSTWGECSPESHNRLRAFLQSAFPGHQIGVSGPSWWRGERRVADVCRAQVSLRKVLLNDNIDAVKADIERLQVIGTLMEKQSRVASWGVRTVTGPILTAAAVILFLLLGGLTSMLGETGVTALRYTLVGGLGAAFLYYGLKAVQLTEMANRVWKRGAEYTLILAERRRLSGRNLSGRT
jgi:hypothetical protein